MESTLSNSALRFVIVEEAVSGAKAKKKVPKSSLDRLIYNSENIAHVLTTRKKLQDLRFNELDLLRDIKNIVESNPEKYEKIKNPEEFRREIRATILPSYISKEFIKKTEEKLLSELFSSRKGSDQDSLMTALVFLQSHTDLGLPMEDNPLWETIFNLSLKDGLQFVDSLTVLLEGIDTLKVKDPEILTRDPIILQKTKQICQWPVFWKLLIEHKEIIPFEGLISSILRGELIIELYFDELVHLPFYLYQLFKSELEKEDFLSEMIPDGDKEKIAQDLTGAILKSVEKDLRFILPSLIKRIEKIIKKTTKAELREQLSQAVKTLKEEDQLVNNVFVLMLIAAKISMKKYWENRRDRFFFFTILKNPTDAKNYFDYGRILLRLKKMQTAEQLFNCAIEIEPGSFWGYWGLGQLYLKKDKLEKAEKLLEKALKRAQKLEIRHPNKFRRELFLVKEDLMKLKKKKVKLHVKQQPQIDLFAG